MLAETVAQTDASNYYYMIAMVPVNPHMKLSHLKLKGWVNVVLGIDTLIANSLVCAEAAL